MKKVKRYPLSKTGLSCQLVLKNILNNSTWIVWATFTIFLYFATAISSVSVVDVHLQAEIQSSISKQSLFLGSHIFLFFF